ncbi:unnamed protein product [Owenia fusiformis]|uniref:EGF-like domain-containing protein n=1 Tax=Owenia fusiformis TaxID=6347 RepID=A0A8S4N545_OWEFU|nr:unnamed protein product [Owenia fusiformis]
MKIASRALLVLSGILVTVFWSISAVESRCASSQYPCGNGKCIPLSWRCDEDDDCGDNSDEESCAPRTCSENEFSCPGETKCIPTRWMCDNDSDCQNGTDEAPELCESRSCDEEQFACGDNGQCIPKAWRCDEQADCPNGEDEQGCQNFTCKDDEFTCANGNCITMRWVCDRDDDCEDNSDEHNCAPPTCSPEEFMCNKTRRCIPLKWRCDVDQDCTDNSDEENCPSTPPGAQCMEQEFQCAVGSCIHIAWKCDGDEDCDDGSDERDCGEITCKPDQFQCGPNDCISGQLQCDGSVDCEDGSDEDDCPTPTTHCDEQTEFDCLGDGSECIQLSQVCDGTANCGSGEDEPRGTDSFCQTAEHNECKTNNGGCAHTCTNAFTHVFCSCNKGYKLGADGKSCEDIDECLIPGTCSQLCKNLIGSFKCDCYDGYTLERNTNNRPHFCKANGDVPSLLFSNRRDVRVLKLDSTKDYKSFVDGTRSAVATDYDHARQLVFWSDVAEERIYRKDIGNENRMELINSDIATPDGMAYDWIHHLLYWTDTGKDTIEVVHIDDNTKRSVLVSTDLDEPRAIVVDPHEGWMYWSDWGSKPRIEKISMDGLSTTREQIVTHNIQWPNGLTIDYVSRRLFWVDAKRHSIDSSDLDGLHRQLLLTDENTLKHPFSITVFEDYVYWTDWKLESISKMNKFTGKNYTQVAKNLFSPMDIHVYHPLKQVAGTNYCEAQSMKCSHLCLPKARLNARSAKVACACPSGWELAEDQQTCRDTRPTTVAAAVTTESVESSSANPSQSPAITQPNTVSAITAQIPSEHTVTYKPDPHHPPVVVMNGTTTPKTHIKTPEAEDSNSGQLIGIIVGVVVGVLIIVVIIGVLVWRNYRRKATKSMNFDNPVYRKTTEDQFSLEKNQYQPARQSTHHHSATLEPLTAPGTELV